jgi:hypothetical protein
LRLCSGYPSKNKAKEPYGCGCDKKRGNKSGKGYRESLGFFERPTANKTPGLVEGKIIMMRNQWIKNI